jgi:Ca2+-binding EF-hand superfamily protein
LKEIDTNGDGEIDFEEFKAGVLKFIDHTYSSANEN